MKFTGLILSLFVLFSSCSKDIDAPVPQELAAGTMLNVAYGNDPLQNMDVYLPAGRSSAATKVIVMIHGGSWSAGDKNDMTQYVDTLQKRLPGSAIININYRLASFSGNTFPTQENDVKAALQFIAGKKSEYVISDKFVLLGVSAGSHLALLQAYKNASPRISAVVDFFGPTDLADMYNNPASASAPPSGISFLLSGTPASNASLYASSSPITYVSAQSPPTIILHGGTDILVRYQQSEQLRNKLLLNNVANQYVFYPLQGHGWIDADLADSFNKVQAFLNTYVP